MTPRISDFALLTHTRPARTRVILIAGLAIAAVVVAVTVVRWSTDRADGPPNGDGSTDSIRLTQTALAATEDFDLSAAETRWSELRLLRPDDLSTLRNWTLNRVLRVEQLTAQATNASLSVEDRQAARDLMPETIANAREAINGLEQRVDDPIFTAWLRAYVDVREASLLPASMKRSNRRKVYDRLSAIVREDSGEDAGGSPASILAGIMAKILELTGPPEELPEELLRDAAQVFAKLSDDHPENLLLATLASRYGVAIENPDVSTYVRRTAELVEAIEPSLRRNLTALATDLDDLVVKVEQGIESGQWDQTSLLVSQWFNLIVPTELMLADRRRVSPHPLDQLSFAGLRELRAERATETAIDGDSTPLNFDTKVIPESGDAKMAIAADFDVDLKMDIATVDDQGRIQVFRQTESGEWELAGELELEHPVSGLLATDLYKVDSHMPDQIKASRTETSSTDMMTSIRHNVAPTLLAFGDQGIDLITVDLRPQTAAENRVATFDRESGLEAIRDVVTVVDGDFEGDGDLDLAVATADGELIAMVNRGNQTFFEASRVQTEPITAMAVGDVDRDLDLDVVTAHGQTGEVGIWENLLHLQFRHRLVDGLPPLVGIDTVHVAEVDGNVSWDLVMGGTDFVAVAFTQTADIGAWTIEETVTADSGAAGALVSDLDNDSLVEIVSRDAMLFQTTGALLSDPQPLDLDSTSIVDVADFDGDGWPDLLTLGDDGVRPAINLSSGTGKSIRVRLRGIADNNSNSGRVNHYAIGSVLEMRFGPHYRSAIIEDAVTHFGLGDLQSADSIRIIFPNGLTQTIRDPATDTLIEEVQTLKGSCPYLYAWDGQQYAFVTDCLWAAPLGLQVARDVVAKDRPWEYLKVDGRSIRPKDGVYELRLTEELWEVAYFDHVSLQAIDHPAELEIFTNEKVGPPAIAAPKVYAFPDSSRVAAEDPRDTTGQDVSAELSRIDGRFVQGFDRRIRQGLCPPHWIELTVPKSLVGQLSDDDRLSMVLTGWILPTDTSLNIQIDQNPELLSVEYPSVWVPAARDADPAKGSPTIADDESTMPGWQKAIPFMGFPGGKTKTIVVDLTDVIDRKDPRVRVRTSAQIYWDAAEFAVHDDDAPLIRHDLTLQYAEVAYRGFSARSKPSPRHPEVYDYGNADLQPKWPPLRGQLSDFGPATERLAAWDDSMVVISGGDEIRLQFSVPDSDVPEGYRRDFVLHCVGWDKDADLNTLTGQAIGPLPFRKMSSYPPSGEDLLRSAQTERANRWHRQRRQPFREFWYRPN